MKSVEKILGGLILLFMISRLLFIYPFSAILVTFSCLFLSILYLFFGFALFNNIRLRYIFKKKSYDGKSTLRVLGCLCTGFILSFVVIYSLFKFQRWPYGEMGLMISLRLLAFIMLVVVIKYLVSKNKFYSNFLIRPFIIGLFGIILFYTSSEKLLELQYKNFPDYIEAEKQLNKDPENEYLRKKANDERLKMNASKL